MEQDVEPQSSRHDASTRWRGWIPVVAASIVLGVRTSALYRSGLRLTGGEVSFPIDDAFIHLALAKQLASHGVYGVTPHVFSAASSSIGWPIVLALGIRLFGPDARLALVLNLVAAVGTLSAVSFALRRLAPNGSSVATFVVALAVLLLTPLETLILTGMEHTVHAAATIAFVAVAAAWLDGETKPARETLRDALPVVAWAAATTLWRYEGAFPVALVALLALLRGRIVPAVAIASGGALPIVGFGLFAVAHGAHFLPTPVLLKGRSLDLAHLVGLFDSVALRLATNGYVLTLAAACAALAARRALREGPWHADVIALVLALGTVLSHLALASLGWFYRYESYLIALAVTVLGASVTRDAPPVRDFLGVVRSRPLASVLLAALALVTVAPLAWRASKAIAETPLACRNIYEQQTQIARFLAKYFPHRSVAVNDIGAVAWLGNDRVIDLMGLASLPVAEAKHLRLEQPLAPSDVVRLTRGVEVAIVYDEWFSGNLPASWLRVARWTIEDNRSPAFPSVAIYAADPSAYPDGIGALRAFAPSLPRRVHIEGRASDQAFDRSRLRAGDRVAIAASAEDAASIGTVAPDGTVLVRGVGPVPLRGKTSSEAALEIQSRLGARDGVAPGAPVGRVMRVATRTPSIHVAGSVLQPGEIPVDTLTIDAALASAGVTPSAEPADAWVWRETASGFVRLSRDALDGGALVDGDIVIVPPRGGDPSPTGHVP